MTKPEAASWSAYRGGRYATLAQVLMTRYVDRFHPAAMVSDFVGDPEILEAFRLINGVPGIAEAVIRWYGPIRATQAGFSKNDDYSGPTPIEIVAPLRAVDPNEQRMAVRYLDLMRGDSSSLETPSSLSRPSPDRDAEGILEWGNSTPWVRKFAEEWRSFCLAMLPFYEDMHYISREERDSLTKDHGLPLTRPLRNRAGDLDRSPAGDTEDQDVGGALLGSLTRDIYCAIRAQALFTLCSRAIAEEGIIEENVSADRREVGRRSNLIRLHDPDQNRVRTFQVKDDLVRLMIDSLNRAPPSRLLAFMIGVKNLMSALITADPTFVLRNSTRDTLSAFVLGRAWMVPVVDTLRGTGAFAVSSQVSRQWFLQGGASSTLLENAADDPEQMEPVLPTLAIASRLRRIVRQSRRGYNLVTTPARALEAGTRIMQFQRMLDTGATPRQAALAARAVSTDFANRGAADDPVTFVIRTTVFLNAAIQGLNETRKVAFTASGLGGKTGFRGAMSAKFWKAGILGLTGLSAVAWYHSTSTSSRLDSYESLTTYHKSAYVHFTGIPAFQGHLRIPVPFEVGFLFQKVPEMAFDFIAGHDTRDTDPIARGILPPTATHMLQTSFLLSSLPVPSAVAPVFDHLRNRNFFGSEIVPYYMMGRPERARHFRSTPSTYVRAGEWLNVSPLVVKHYFESYGGNAARNAIVVAEWLAWDDWRNGPKAFPTGAMRATGMSAFASAPYRSSSRWADDYYALADKVGDRCYMARRLDGRRLLEYVADNRPYLRLCEWKTEADKALRQFSSTVYAEGFMNRNLSRGVKERRIQSAYEWRNRFHRRAYTIARQQLLR